MIKSKKAESMVGIIIGSFILSIIILGITNLIINHSSTIFDYQSKRDISILKINSKNIVKKLDISPLTESEIFYLYKNNSTKNYEIKTGSLNESYKYIDRLGNNIDNINTYDGPIFSRTLLLERHDLNFGNKIEIIKVNIKDFVKN